ncbi:MAG: CD225/dispanin family protein [Thermoguttaceae bacterium]
MADPTLNAPAYVPNYLVQAILTTIFCCLPFGIVAIIFAAQVNGKLAAGDCAGAVQTSKQAKMWCWLAFGIGLAIQVVVMIFYFIVFVAAISTASHGAPPHHF